MMNNEALCVLSCSVLSFPQSVTSCGRHRLVDFQERMINWKLREVEELREVGSLIRV